MTPTVTRTTTLVALALLCALFTASCTSVRNGLRLDEHPLAPMPGSDLAPDAIAEQLEIGRREIDSDRAWEAVRRALELIEDSSLGSEQGNAATRLLLDAVTAGAQRAERSSEFRRIRASRLPRAARAIRTVGMGRLLLAEKEPFEAFLEIRQLEDAYGSHHLSAEAGDVVAQAGIDLFQSKGRYMLFFPDRGRSPAVLEYLVLRHPTHAACDQAYWLLGNYSTDRRDFERAIAFFEDLVLFHPGSANAVAAEAMIPRLRIADHARHDFDVDLVKQALEESESWLARHGSDRSSPERVALIEEMTALRIECLERYSRSDLGIARFYAKVGESFGAHLHAERALELARRAGSAQHISEAEALLHDHPLPATAR